MVKRQPVKAGGNNGFEWIKFHMHHDGAKTIPVCITKKSKLPPMVS